MAFGPGAVLDHLPPDILMNCRNQNCPRLVMPDRCAIHDIWSEIIAHAEMTEVAIKIRHEVLLVRQEHHRSEEHTSELQSLMSISYAVFCLKNKNKSITTHNNEQ